jgi:hypothetical protein
MRTPRCTSHCRGCDRHFAGDAAFDLHRRGSFVKNTRHCIDPAKDKRFEVRADIAPCNAGERAGVLWGRAGERQRFPGAAREAVYRYPVGADGQLKAA